jgi:hypothetical protein
VIWSVTSSTKSRAPKVVKGTCLTGSGTTQNRDTLRF